MLHRHLLLLTTCLLSCAPRKSPPPNVAEVPIDQAPYQNLSPQTAPNRVSASDLPNSPGPSPLDSVVSQNSPWYNPEPLLASIRPSARASLLTEIGSLDSLPLYDLNISINMEGRSFELTEDLYFTNNTDKALPDLLFRIYGNQAEHPAISVEQSKCLDLACEFSRPHPSSIRVRPEKPIGPKERLHLSFVIKGNLEYLDSAKTDALTQSMESMLTMSGGKKSATNYGLLSVSDGFVSMAGFFPILAHRQKGAWEQVETNSLGDFGSDDLCNLRATVTVAPSLLVVSPGSVVKDTLYQDSNRKQVRRRFDIAAAATRDFSIFAGAGLVSSSRQLGDVNVVSHYLSADSASGQRVLDVASQSMSYFEAKFGVYPYAEFDAIEVPLVGGAGGVEFAGTIALASMFYRPIALDDSMGGLMGLLGQGADASSGGLFEDVLEFTTAHEVAHQWWHAIVGNDARQHPFVDESLTQYSTLLYYEGRYGSARAKKASDAHVRMNYQMMRMMGGADGPVDRPVAAFSSPTAYAGLIYGKGPFFYEAARKRLGDDAFFGALRGYAGSNRFRTASKRGPVDALIAAGHGAEIRSLARRWLDEQHGDQDLGKGGSPLGSGHGAGDPQTDQLMQLLGGSGQGANSGQGIQPEQIMKLMQELLGGSH